MAKSSNASLFQRIARGLRSPGKTDLAGRDGDSQSFGGSALRNWLLAGESEDGRAFEVQISEAQLARHKYGLTVGRNDRLCEIVLDHPSLSRRHARFLLLDGKLAMEDLNSANGCMVDGKVLKPFRPEPLGSDSMLVLADLRLQVHSSEK